MLIRLVMAWIAIVLVSAISRPAIAEPYEFRGFRLGMPLDDFRKQRFPEAPGARMLCGNDSGSVNLRPLGALAVTDDEAIHGIQACGAFTAGNILTSGSGSLPPEWSAVATRFGSAPAIPTFWFTSGTAADPQPRLFKITLRANADYWSEFRTGFVARYGKPSTIDHTIYSNFRGAKLDNEKLQWSNADSEITLTKRLDGAQRLVAVFVHRQLLAQTQKTPSATSNPVDRTPTAPNCPEGAEATPSQSCKPRKSSIRTHLFSKIASSTWRWHSSGRDL